MEQPLFSTSYASRGGESTLDEIEIGWHEVVPSFIRAYDEGGTVYEGKPSYPSMEAALQDLETGIKAYLDQWGI